MESPLDGKDSAMHMDAVLPDRERLRCDEIRFTAEQIPLVVSASAPVTQCPVCGQFSARVHSRYARTLTGAPVPKSTWASAPGSTSRRRTGSSVFLSSRRTNRRTLW